MLKYCFIFLTGFLLWEAGSYAAADTGIESTETDQAVISNAPDHSCNHPIHQPLGGETNQLETQDESSSDEDPHDERHPFLPAASFSPYRCLQADKSCSFHLTARLRNRTTVQLFILYHSWKSFPSRD